MFDGPRAPTPFPYTTLFRSRVDVLRGGREHVEFVDAHEVNQMPPPGGSAEHAAADRDVLAEPDFLQIPEVLRQREAPRSEEHTSELQSLTNLVCRLLLEKKK